MLISQNSFFENMDKPILRDIYARTFDNKGLVNNTALLKELPAFYGNPERLPKLYESFEPWQKQVFLQICRSGSRGLRFKELRLVIPVGGVNDLTAFVTDLAKNFVIWRTEGDAENSVYRAFEETFAFAMSQEADFADTQDRHAVSYETLLDFHVCRILAMIKLGELRINNASELHRRSQQICESAFTFSSAVSSKAAVDEAVLILQFLTAQNWIAARDDVLSLSHEVLPFLNKNGFRLHQEMFHWWLGVRFGGMHSHLASLLNCMKKPVSTQAALELFWALDPTVRLSRNVENYTFEKLPRVLRELWFFGVVDFYMGKNGSILAVGVNELGRNRAEKILGGESAEISTLPNFEMIIPANSSPRVLFYAACLAVPQNDETYLRFKFEKDSFIEALHAGFSDSEVKQFYGWIKPPENVASTLEEWAASFFSSSIFDARILKIEDKAVLADLSEFPQFMKFVIEKIPGYGFIINPEFEADVRAMLVHYGLTPAEDANGTDKGIITSGAWTKSFEIAWPKETTPDYLLKKQSAASADIANGKKKFGDDFESLDISGLVQELRYAKKTETLFVARIQNPAKKLSKPVERTFKVLGLRIAQIPPQVRVSEYGSDKMEFIELEHIREIKLLHKQEVDEK